MENALNEYILYTQQNEWKRPVHFFFPVKYNNFQLREGGRGVISVSDKDVLLPLSVVQGLSLILSTLFFFLSHTMDDLINTPPSPIWDTHTHKGFTRCILRAFTNFHSLEGFPSLVFLLQERVGKKISCEEEATPSFS